MAATQGQYVALAKQLPPRLTRFFARYPPPALLGPSQNSSTVTTAPNTSSSDPNSTGIETQGTVPSIANSHPSASASSTSYASPFAPQKHPITGRYHDPQFSLRRQADLVKLARDHGVEELLPFSIKKTAERGRSREELGLRVKGTGVNDKVKGKLWERTMKTRLEKRRQAMLDMPRMIEEWKQRGHGRGWKKWPK